MAAYFSSAKGASFLGGSGGMPPPQKILKYRCLEILFSPFPRQYLGLRNDQNYVPVNSKTAHPPHGQTPGHLTFLKNFGQIPRYIVSLDGQMPHPLELQRGSNPPPSRHAKATVETSSAKFSVTTNFLFSLSSLHTLNKGIFHDRTI